MKKEDSHDIISRLDRIGAGGGTNMYPAMTLAYQQLADAADAGVRHMVLLTDGMTEGAGYQQLVEQMRKDQNITVSTVAVGADADVKLLEQLARAGGGRFHQALTPELVAAHLSAGSPHRGPTTDLRTRRRISTAAHRNARNGAGRRRRIAADHRLRAHQQKTKSAG